MIKPEEMIRQHGLNGLNRTADEYYQRIADPTPLLAKPFWDTHDGAVTLSLLGNLMAGLRLASTMRVLDFGSGPCWLGRFLHQMRCEVICLDPSEAALEMGRKLFEAHPIIGTPISDPTFLAFDGVRIDLPDNSVDRVVSLAAFHHVPNPNQALAEIFRVLKPGGIVGFAEPGLGHSSNPQSQSEMAYHNVLENDIHLRVLLRDAERIGFRESRFRLFFSPFRDADAKTFFQLHDQSQLTPTWLSALGDDTRSNYVFFLTKGDAQNDSRLRIGLQAQLSVDLSATEIEGQTLRLKVRAKNTGSATWLDENTQNYGVVMVGAHLLSDSGESLNYDFGRTQIAQRVAPGKQIEATLQLTLPPVGRFRIAVDLVSEGVCWFEINGAKPIQLNVRVADGCIAQVEVDDSAPGSSATKISDSETSQQPSSTATSEIAPIAPINTGSLETEVIRLRNLVAGYERGRFMRLMRWLKSR